MDGLKLYAYGYQAKFGDNTGEKPSVFDVLARLKWESWNDIRGISKIEAQHKFIELASGIMIKNNLGHMIEDPEKKVIIRKYNECIER